MTITALVKCNWVNGDNYEADMKLDVIENESVLINALINVLINVLINDRVV